MSHFTKEQLDEMESFDRFQALKYGNIIGRHTVVDEFENNITRIEQETNKVNEYHQQQLDEHIKEL